MIALAGVVSTILAAATAQWFSWRISLAAFGISCLAAAAVALAQLSARKQTDNTSSPSLTLLNIWRILFQRSELTLALIATGARNASLMGSIVFIGALYKDQFGFETWQLGPLVGFGSLIFAGGAEIAGRISVKLQARTTVVVIAITAGLVGGLIPILLHLPLNLILWAVYCVLTGMFAGALNGLVLRLAFENRGTAMAINATLNGLGGALGVGLCGFGISLGGYAGLSLPVLGLAVLSAALVWGSYQVRQTRV
jgi:predicted MFS family arabinose efflux permease